MILEQCPPPQLRPHPPRPLGYVDISTKGYYFA
jgi:hypothetical protein